MDGGRKLRKKNTTRKKETKRDCREQKKDEVGETFCRQPFSQS